MGTVAMDTWDNSDTSSGRKASKSRAFIDKSEEDMWLFDPYRLDPSQISNIEHDMEEYHYYEGCYDSNLQKHDTYSRSIATTRPFGTTGKPIHANGNSSKTTDTDSMEIEAALKDNKQNTDNASGYEDDEWEDIRLLDPEEFMPVDVDDDEDIPCDKTCICRGGRSMSIIGKERTFKVARSLRLN